MLKAAPGIKTDAVNMMISLYSIPALGDYYRFDETLK